MCEVAKKRRVVVTGIGLITPCGNDIDSFWKNSLTPESYTSKLEDYVDYGLLSLVKGEVRNFDHRKYGISDEDAKRMGRTTLFALAATKQAIEDSKLFLDEEDKERIGVCVSSAIADTPFMAQEFEKVKDLIDGNITISDLIDDHIFEKALFNCMVTDISSRYNLHGTTFSLSTGCTGGIDAIGYSFEQIQNSNADVMICGASESPLTGISFASFDQINATTQKNSIPNKASSPYDLSRDGFVLAEGCGILILEDYEKAIKRNATIYCEIGGYRTCNNAWHMTDLIEDGTSMINIIKQTLDDCKLKLEDIDYINAHGSSTPQNDVFETNAFKSVFGDFAYNIPISSTKSKIGHPLSAASAIELVQCCLIFKNQIIPPTCNYSQKDPKCDLDYTINQYREQNVTAILKNASGFAGLHSVIILKKVS